ncbi:Energy-coupling factor transporter ATP-binding protein EcfA1 [Lactobacillus helveticus]|uniref:Energy-coupling factor transporter ATP-binding protein EcfA1 n=3 Tax=Lactobacillus helveticus TaxID=1587 RepID=A0AAV4E5F7_LACHE|nr:cobalt-specific ABC transport protein ATPase component [Lactobacillus helveticus CNRZ32]NRO16325.1 Energy-coupling factor transporter ATP-binding protein EcfA1 [Lactobacillus helveticus]CDI59891.1 Cobalt ABC superfamily ATP binding cassette transporter, ABC protein [Lactobacillus helveticus CIRM-BIA 104]CDI62577.1 Cobalt ABC superfamily ATP binding cassette transporter, ABC protein [Lactobacillus helveticus CIRM-BIA 103]POO31393.1 Energy-coupling factor transporter ATP-binding protein EcfA1 
MSMSNDNAIEFKHVKFTYPDSKKAVLKDVNFVVKKGSWTSLIGHNGSGKSTISKLINGLLLPDENSDSKITVLGTNVTAENIWDIREKVGIVFQNPDNQFVGATVGDDVAFGLENRGVPRQEMIKIVRNVLSEVGMLEYIDSEPANLSGGQKQRIAIAGILAVEPQIIILDESTSMLDPSGRKQILKIIIELMKKKQLTVVSITHDIDEANMADSVIVLNDGEIIDQDSPVKIFNKTTMLKQIGLDIPFTNKLILALDKSGVSVPQNLRTKDELKQYLCQLNLKI